MTYDTPRDFALQQDERDELKNHRNRFIIPVGAAAKELVYFVGHSLGLQPRSTAAAVAEELEAWASLGVSGHFTGTRPWMLYHDVVGAPMARIVGAQQDEIVFMNALTVNLHVMMMSFYRPTASRYKIVMEDHAFPSDRYAVASQARFHGYGASDAVIVLKPREGEDTLRTEDIVATIEQRGPEIALVLLGGVNYYTGQAFDIRAITAAAHRVGATAGFDLAHAAGNIELRLHDWDVDFAVWCTYKYLNSGPGSLGGCFVHQRHSERHDLPRLEGWWGEDAEKRFEMAGSFRPASGAAGWQISNPNVFSLGAIRASLDLFESAGAAALRRKQRHLTGYLEFLLRRYLGDRIVIITPDDPGMRGSQLSLLVRSGRKEIYDKLRARGIVCDWRNPNVIRAAPVPMYNTFDEVWRFVDTLQTVTNEPHGA